MKYKLQPFLEWYKAQELSKPWLVVGQGPSFSHINKVDLDSYSVLALNHVMFEIPCLLGHAIDLDVYNTSDNKFLCQHLVTPWEPHINFKPGNKSLLDLMFENRLEYRNILYYNSSRTRNKNLKYKGPDVRVRFFGSVAAMNLLAMAGVKTIHTLGIDGGSKYHPSFDEADLLANGRQSFDSQFSEFKLTEKRYGVTISPLNLK
jgi:hypothetical protein